MSKIKIGDCFGNGPTPFVCEKVMDSINWPLVEYEGELIMCNPDIYRPISTLHLPIGNDAKKYGGAWFDMILSGVKKEEYREFKAFNGKRLCETWDSWIFAENQGLKFKPLKVIHLTNGYGHDKPQLWAHIESITIGRGKPEWGAPTDRDVFIIKFGEVFHTKNLKP